MDNDIFLPENMKDAYDYEYIFHTHPPTPTPGGRASMGILYEYPSRSDIIHFIDHYNDGKTQGSIVLAPEGLYNIRKKEFDLNKIEMNHNKFRKKYKKYFRKYQTEMIEKYGVKFNETKFFGTISQDTYFTDKMNIVLNDFDIHIDFYPRIQIKKKWIIDTIHLPVYVIDKK